MNGVRLLKKWEATRPFSEAEAWGLFRLAALGEAFGWTVLIIGVAIERYRLPGQRIAIPIAGQIHGTLFLVYFGVLLATYSSLRWSRSKFLLALVVGVPPYGTLVFEQIAAWQRRHHRSRVQFQSIALHVMTQSLAR